MGRRKRRMMIMRRRLRGRGGVRRIYIMEEGVIVKIHLGPFCLFCSYCFKVLSSKKKLNNRIVDIHKYPT